jgi:hypothetical protein
VGAKQNPPKAASKKSTARRFQRVDFQKIEGAGKNALDFHIAFQLGRIIETAPKTECIVLSKDKGFDPLLAYLNKNGLHCRRISTMDELVSNATVEVVASNPGLTVCPKCAKASTIEHHGGRWCSNCGSFAVRPDSNQLPSVILGIHDERRSAPTRRNSVSPTCAWCHQQKDMSNGIYDDGEWMCGDCVAGYQ